MRKLALIFVLSALVASAADVYTLGLIPLGGSVEGAPGGTVGWGYSIQNQSASLWLVPTDLNAGVFTNGTPALLFDFPVLAPSSSVAMSFDPAQSTGLFELTWDSAAPASFSNTGMFTLDAQWWSGDPSGGGVFVSGAPSISLPYAATVSASAVPEPGTLGLTVLMLVAALALTQRRIRGLRAVLDLCRVRVRGRAISIPFVMSVFCIASLICATPARATQYNWTYGGDSYHSGSGTLTASGGTSPSTITAITGTFDGATILNLLDLGHCCAAPGNDNLLYSSPSTLLDGNGLAFETLSGDPSFFNILFLDNAYSVIDDSSVLTFGGTFTATQVVGSQPGPATPEPTSLGILAAGLLCMIAFFRSRWAPTSGLIHRTQSARD